MKFKLVNILYSLCLCLQENHVLGSRQGTSGQRFSQFGHGGDSEGEVDYSGSNMKYDTTITTEMNYVASASKKDKKGNHHAEYEYIGGGGYVPHGSEYPKGAKKHDDGYGYGHTYEPTDDGYTDVPTHHPTPPKSSKKGCYYEHEGTLGPTHMGKGKGKGSKKESLPSKKACKSVKSSKKGGDHGSYVPSAVPYPTESPASSGSGDYGRPRPPTPVSAPTLIPPAVSPTVGPAAPPGSFTASPTDAGSIAIDLEPYSLLYQTIMKRQATRGELAELTDVTRLYLEEFMFEEFAGSSFTFLDDFITRMVTSTFLSGDSPYVVDYSSTARFSPFSSVTPSAEQLNEALVIAFSGDNLAEYTDRLQGMSVENVFQGAVAFFGAPTDQVSEKSKSNASTIAAAAVAATILAAAVVIYRRRMADEELTGKDLDKGASDSTVAGETFAGETYDGSASASIASREHSNRYNNVNDAESDAQRAAALGTIDEDDDDDNSVLPTWGANLSYDDWESQNHLDNQGSFESNLNPQSELNSISTKSTLTDDRTLRRVNTEGSSVAASAVPKGIASSHSFDEMALQGFKSNDEGDDNRKSAERPVNSESHENGSGDSQDMTTEATISEEKSLLDSNELREVPLERTMSSSSGRSTRRPRTVEEIEAMLSVDDDEESQGLASLSRSFSNGKSDSWPARPRTVEEIESLLSAGIDDDNNEETFSEKA